MKRLRLVCVGKPGKPFERDGIAEYVKRLGAFYDFCTVELDEQPTLKKECDLILKKLGQFNVLLDVGGELLSSEQFADMIRCEHERRDEITFVIGGAAGVDERVRAACQKRISLGRMTYTHRLARLLVCEQLYRAGTIIRGVPYHK